MRGDWGEEAHSPQVGRGDPASSRGIACVVVVLVKEIHLSPRLSIDWSVNIPQLNRGDGVWNMTEKTREPTIHSPYLLLPEDLRGSIPVVVGQRQSETRGKSCQFNRTDRTRHQYQKTLLTFFINAMMLFLEGVQN